MQSVFGKLGIVDKFKEYKIPHIGLKKEVHDFIFHLNETFFSNFEDSIIGKSNIEAVVHFDKTHEPNLLTFQLNGEIDTECDKCAAITSIKIEGNFRVFIKIHDELALSTELDDPEILFIRTDTPEIDLTPYLYEFSHLCIPFIKSCEKPFESKNCDMEVASKLNALKEEEKTEHQTIDPRWAALNKLKENNK